MECDWRSAAELGIRIRPELTVRIEISVPTPEVGFPATKELLARKEPFTALFAYTIFRDWGDLALREAGLRVPQDVSVVGFDDIPGAAFANPGLTTVRQPLLRMARSRLRRWLIRSRARGVRAGDRHRARIRRTRFHGECAIGEAVGESGS